MTNTAIDPHNRCLNEIVEIFNIKPKYRLWRAEIPRDTVNKLDRIRSPWVRLKLTLHNTKKLRQLIHTISVNYTLPIQPLKEN